jgi:hypothetical protein
VLHELGDLPLSLRRKRTNHFFERFHQSRISPCRREPQCSRPPIRKDAAKLIAGPKGTRRKSGSSVRRFSARGVSGVSFPPRPIPFDKQMGWRILYLSIQWNAASTSCPARST